MKVSKKEFKWHISCNGLFRNIFNLALSRIYASRVGCKFAYCNHSVSPSSMSIINIRRYLEGCCLVARAHFAWPINTLLFMLDQESCTTFSRSFVNICSSLLLIGGENT